MMRYMIFVVGAMILAGGIIWWYGRASEAKEMIRAIAV